MDVQISAWLAEVHPRTSHAVEIRRFTKVIDRTSHVCELQIFGDGSELLDGDGHEIVFEAAESSVGDALTFLQANGYQRVTDK